MSELIHRVSMHPMSIELLAATKISHNEDKCEIVLTGSSMARSTSLVDPKTIPIITFKVLPAFFYGSYSTTDPDVRDVYVDFARYTTDKIRVNRRHFVADNAVFVSAVSKKRSSHLHFDTLRVCDVQDNLKDSIKSFMKVVYG